ncbi:MAG: UDP-N-acetylmuramoyl-L-alanine--D-glutamate ligase [Caldilineales bacterium]
MNQQSFAGQHVVILGLARQGTAAARFFVQQGAQVVVSDAAPAERLSDPLAQLAGALRRDGHSIDEVTLALGGHPLSLLDGCDLVCLSGGVPPQIALVQEALARGVPLTNDTILTLERSPAPAIGITGSSGKTTTTTLVGLMLAASGLAAPSDDQDSATLRSGPQPHVWVGGNIGQPLVDKLAQIDASDWLVLELSSFQLELFDEAAGGRSLSPQIAAILNVTPNHLDRHPSMSHYAACKANILRWQRAGDAAVLGADDAVTGRWLRSGAVDIAAGPGQPAMRFPIRARSLGFGVSEAVGEGCWLRNERLSLWFNDVEEQIVTADDVRLRGRHNLLNVAAASAIAALAGASVGAMAQVARTFGGVPHRLELVREVNGVGWYNDSIATAPERAAAALRSFREPVVLLAGGRDKKLPWDEFARLAHQRVRLVVTFGEAAGLIERALAANAPEAASLPVIHTDDLAAAVQAAAGAAKPGDVVLLSPGGTSYDAYRDFEARGEHFRSLVASL